MSDTPAKYGNTVAEILGGRHGVREPTAAEWHSRIGEGLPVKAVDAVKKCAALNDTEMCRLLGIGEATLRRARASGMPLDSSTSDRLYRFSKVLAHAIDVLESAPAAMSWLRRAQVGLAGAVPLGLLVTQAGADEVDTLLGRIEFSVYT
jgi:putative toxin-antitoxin system antitoxin component (TIGR02293 family)